jgi:hypothetical protein
MEKDTIKLIKDEYKKAITNWTAVILIGIIGVIAQLIWLKSTVWTIIDFGIILFGIVGLINVLCVRNKSLKKLRLKTP